MKASDHPFYQEEQQHLSDTYAQVGQAMAATAESAKLEYEWSAGVLEKRRVLIDLIESYKEILQQPYFGRVEWKPAGAKEAETFYVGLRAFPKRRIFSWRDNRAGQDGQSLAGELYYTLKTTREQGTLLLKRSFELDTERRALSTISDDFVHKSLQAVLEKPLLPTRFTDTLLVQLLTESRAGQLREIVATIQQKQFEIICLPTDTAVLIQGAPGSGKTVIALHRVAYLLYNDSRLREQGVLILGPSPLFLHYTARVLPVLGEYRVPQQAISEWIQRQLETPLRVESQEQALEFLLDASAPLAHKVMRLRNAQTKGSERMAQLLDSYAEHLYESAWAGRGELVVNLPGQFLTRGAQNLVVRRSVDDLRRIAGDLNLPARPLNQRRDTLIDHLAELVMTEVRPLLRSSDERLERETQRLVEQQLRSYWEGWESFNTVLEYRRLFRNPEILRQIGGPFFKPDELELMALDAPRATTPFRFSDLAALMYLHLLFNGVPSPYGLVVVDEAQDLTPLHFKVLQRVSRSGALTLLGDLAQGIYGQQGVQAWSALRPVLPDLQQETIRESYRATQEITEFANAILRRAGVAEDQLAITIARMGERPSLHPAADLAAVAQTVITVLRRETQWQSFAVVAKTLSVCQALAQQLRAQGFTEFELIADRDSQYAGGVALIPSYLTKGLEFDVVILADADAATYPPDELSLRLLYVSLTRAVHSLHITWSGTLTPWLDDQLDQVLTQSALDEALTPRPVTLKAYADQRGIDPDWCVERLAATDRLWLLKQGRIDETLLEIAVAATESGPRRASREMNEERPVVFRPELERQIREVLAEWDIQPDPALQDGLALVQLAYALFRPQLRTLQLLPPAGAEVQLGDQFLALAGFSRTLRALGQSVPPGQWLTKPQLIRSLAESRQAAGHRLITALLRHGLLEELLSDPTRSRVRLSPDSAASVLERSLGETPASWEADLAQAVPTTPELARLLADKEA